MNEFQNIAWSDTGPHPIKKVLYIRTLKSYVYALAESAEQVWRASRNGQDRVKKATSDDAS